MSVVLRAAAAYWVLLIAARRIGRLIDGTPVITYEHDAWRYERMRSLRIEEQDVMAAARQRGLERLEQVC